MNSKSALGLGRDIGIIVISVFVAINLLRTGAIDAVLGYSQGFGILASFFAGIFFTSVFTTAPATVALYEISKDSPVIMVAMFGAIGALIGDFIIFRFVKDDLSEHLLSLFKMGFKRRHKVMGIFKTSYFRWLSALVGGLIIASPLPDELGLMMMGLTKVDYKQFIAMSLFFNFIGILIIGLLAQ